MTRIIDRNAVLARVETIADTLGLPYSEVEEAMSEQDGIGIIDFAMRHGQSIDWIVTGDVRSYIRWAADRSR